MSTYDPCDPFALSAKLGFTRPVHVGRDIFASIQTITPEVASEIIKNHHINRNRRRLPSSIAKITQDMSMGRWSLTHQGIAFNDAGVLFDGQHRLQSCVESGASFETLVFFNVTDDSMGSVDLGKTRTTKDVIHISSGDDVPANYISAVRNAVGGAYPMTIGSKAMAVLVTDVFIDGLEFITKAYYAKPNKDKKTTVGPHLAAVLRAFYYFDDKELLEDMVTVLRNASFSSDREGHVTVRHLWRYLIEGMHTGGSNAAVTYLKTCVAIRAYMEGRNLGVLRAHSNQEIPLTPDIVRRIRGVIPGYTPRQSSPTLN